MTKNGLDIAPEILERAPSYSTVQVGNVLSRVAGGTMTIQVSPKSAPGIVLQFQLPSESARVQELLSFSPVRSTVVDVPLMIRRD